MRLFVFNKCRGQLGRPKGRIEPTWRPVPFFKSNIVSVALGVHFTVVVAKEGNETKVYEMGMSITEEGSYHDSPVELAALNRQQCKQVFAGGYCAMALTKEKGIYIWGYIGDATPRHAVVQYNVPTLIMETKTVMDASVSTTHAFFVSDDNVLFSFGAGRFGQLGHGNMESHEEPMQVLKFAKQKVLRAVASIEWSVVLIEEST
jgi:alpha-tubulin suppressor-like RCC1 family protein